MRKKPRSSRLSVGILSLGCPRNLVDSERLAARLRERGRVITEIAGAQTAIINTCAFVRDAKQESIDAILDAIELKREGRLKRIIVCGCLVERYRQELVKELPEVDAFWGRMALGRSDGAEALTYRHFRYLKICEGCVHRCSFCVIPRIKGSFASLPRADVLASVRRFNAAGISELNIIGQDISGYGLDRYRTRCLPALVEDILKASSRIGWVRLLYLYPGPVVERLLPLFSRYGRLCKYIDLPVQHASDRILKAMNRRGSKQSLLRLIERVRKGAAGVALRTSVIVGFPTETDAEVKELLRFIEEVRFERLGAFIYSREEGTPAYALKGQIPERVQRSRFDELMRLQQRIAAEANRSLLGSVQRVLIDEATPDAVCGRTQFDAPEVDGTVFVRSPRRLSPGEFVDVRITDTMEYDLVGEVL